MHGNIYDFIRNEAFNSRNFFDVVYTEPPPGQARQPTFGNKAPLYRRQDFGGTIGGPLYIPGVFNTKKDKTFFFFSEEVRLEKTPTEYNQAVPGLKERGLIMTQQGIQKNLQTDSNGVVYRAFDFSDVCPLNGGTGPLRRAQYPDCPAILDRQRSRDDPQQPVGRACRIPGGVSKFGSGQERIGDFELESHTAAQRPLSAATSVCANYNPVSPDPSDPNHCYEHRRFAFDLLA